jgi:outer membrane immunogenic protein
MCGPHVPQARAEVSGASQSLMSLVDVPIISTVACKRQRSLPPFAMRMPVAMGVDVRRIGEALAALVAIVAAAPAHAQLAAPAATNWSGFYIGAHGGYAWSREHRATLDNYWTLGQPADPVLSPDGGFGGLQLGYNWQVVPRWVVGVEADFSFGKLESGAGSFFNSILPSSVTLTETVKWFSTVRARVGWQFTDRLMFYGTAGIAYGRVEQNASIAFGVPAFVPNGFSPPGGLLNLNCPTPGAPCMTGSSSEVRGGWTIGGGGELALSSNWSLKAEYLYVNLGSNAFSIVGTCCSDIPATNGVRVGDVELHTVRAGLNWRFAGGTPLPVYKSPATVAGWTGFYLGAHGGYGWNDRTTTFLDNVIGVYPDAAFDVEGGIGGIQAGYNWSLVSRWVGGVEADLSLGHIEGNGAATSNFFFGGFFPDTITVSEKTKWFGTARARVGWLITDQFLVYGTGGIAYGRVQQDANLMSTGAYFNGLVGGVGYSCTVGIPCYTGTSSERLTGWTAGGGTEWALGRWSLKAEYLYVNFGERAFPMTATATPPGCCFSPAKTLLSSGAIDFHVARVGLNYRLGGPLPLR